MRVRDIAKRILVAFLVLAMIVVYTPASLAAETGTAAGTQMTSTDVADETEATRADAEDEMQATYSPDAADDRASEEGDADSEEGVTKETAEPGEAAEKVEETPDPKATVAFARETEIDDVTVRAEAETGVFPEDADLIVEKVSDEDEAKATEAIDEVRPGRLNVADSYTYDIKVVDAEGNELQPEEGQKVELSFVMNRAADPNLSADIYHITENEVVDEKTKETEIVLEADKLEAETDAKEETVTAETDGFSLYTIEFTYETLKYSMDYKTSVKLADILAAVGISGEPTEVQSGNTEVLTASNESGEWMITSIKEFEGEVTLTVTIADADYVINVKAIPNAVFVDSWKALQNAVEKESNNGKTVILENDIKCNNGDSIKVDGDDVDEITIDLAGHTMNRDRSSSTGDGHVINVKDKATLTIVSSTDGGKLTGGYATDGGGIKIEKNSKCIINSNGKDGVIIQGNRSKKDGGGIYVWGTLEMNGGTITGNKAGDEGGGIYVEDTGRLDIDGVTISENASDDDGGGLRVDLRQGDNPDGTIKNCLVTDNKSTESDGGGLSLEAEEKMLEVTDTDFIGNTASDEGGAINVDGGKLQMTGGRIIGSTGADGGGIMNDGQIVVLISVEISGNKSTKYNGGAITNKDDGTTVLRDCKLVSNISKNHGGAIYSDGLLTIHGGIIGGDKNSYNMAYEGGGGIWVAGGSIEVGGAPVVTDNRTSDIYLCKGRKITIADALKDSEDPSKKAKIGVVLSQSVGVFTTGFLFKNPGEEPYDYFIPEPGHSVILDGKEARVNASNWGSLQQRIDKAHNNDVIKLDADYKATEDDRSLKIPAGLVLTIDLNGHTLNRNCSKKTEQGNVIELLSDEFVSSKLTIEDSAGDGKITGGWAENGGGILVNTNCSLTVQGGSITGNKAVHGGAIYCDKEPSASSEHTKVMIEAGTISDNEAKLGGAICSLGTTEIRHIGASERIIISGNKANEDGGAIFVASGTTTIVNGSISGNTASRAGGAVYIGEDAILELYGGSLTSNAAAEGGGILHGCVNGSGALKVQGTPTVIQNRATKGNNILLKNDRVIQVTGELQISGGTGANAMLDVMTDDITKPLTKDLGKCVSEGSTAEEVEKRAGFVFTYNGAKYKDSMEISEADGELYHQEVHTDLPVSSWAELQDAVNNKENEGKIIGLACDIDARNDNYSINVDGDNLGESKSVTIELNGHTMDRKRESDTGDGHAITVRDKAVLTVKDSVGTGLITGGNASNGGGIMIEKNSTCHVENATIEGNEADKDGGGIYVWGTLTMTGGNVTANKAKDNGGGIYVEDTGRLDLDGTVIEQNESKNGGGGLNIHLRNSDGDDGTIKNCHIVNNKSKDSDGGGFSFNAVERTLLVTNTEISGNSADSEGGGIYVDSGRLIMNGFESMISNNTSPDGGGVMNYDGTIEFENITVSGNKTTDESGGGINNKNNAYLTNVTIKNNKSDDAGGGIYSKSSDMELKRCRFEGNNASEKGGGMFTKEDALIEDCAFTSNKAKKGGAIYLADGDVTIKDPIITRNEVDERGGGIYIEDGKPILDGGSITENTAKLSGGGIYMDDTLKIQGIITVKDNFSNGIYVCSGEKLDVTGALYNADAQEEKSEIAVTMEKGHGVFTKNYPGKNPDKEPYEIFTTDPGYSVIKDSKGEGEIAESEWPLLQRLINDTAADVSGGGDIPMLKLDRDWKATDKDVVLTIPEGKSIVIDLAGHTIDRNRSSQDKNGNVFQLRSGNTLVIKDSSDGMTGTVTGGWAEKGGAVLLQAGATCTVKSGNISGNKAESGGGIYVRAGASLEMSGGSINSNNAIIGGGICMEDGDTDHATVELTGGMIIGNNAEVEAGGIRAGSGSVINVSDQPFVRGNTGAAGKNVLLESGVVINVTGTLAIGEEGGFDGARLDLAVKGSDGEGEAVKLTNGLSDNLPEGDVTAEAYAKAVFTYNESGFDEYLEVEGNPGELYKKAIDTDNYVWVSDWDELQDTIKDPDNEGKVIGLKKDITKKGSDRNKGSLKVSHERIIDLNGHKLDRDRGDSDSASDDGSVITIKDGGKLTIRDSAGTGIVTGGFGSQGGGIFINRHGSCTIEGGTICGNRSAGDGGGIYVEGKLKMTGGAVSNNEVVGNRYGFGGGGGIACTKTDTSMDLNGAIISGNKAPSEGGGILVGGLVEHSYTIINCRITDNASGGNGGGIYTDGNENYNKTLTLDGSEISGNTAEGDGGGIFNSNAIIEMTGGSIANNKAKNGAGVMNEERRITLTGVTISGNNAKDNGGGVHNKDETILTDCEIQGNKAEDDGAGLYTFKPMDITGGRISENRAGKDGGGIFIKEKISTFDETTIVTLTGTEIKGNKSGKDGGGIAVGKDTELHLAACTVDGNDAGKDGGGVYVGTSSVLTLDGGTVNGNTTGEYGGGIFVNEYSDTISIRGALKVSDNLGGSDIYLDGKKKLKIKGSLADGDQIANIGVLTETGLGKDFTDGYSDHNKSDGRVVDPATYFTSNEDYVVYLKGGEEAALKAKEVVIDPNPFIKWNSQVDPSWKNLGGRDWMSGISGERYLNEINMPGTHDSCTKDMEGNVSTGYMSLIAGGIGVVIGTPFGLGVGLLIGAALPLAAADHFSALAETQVRYVDEQLADGIRSLDLRVNTYYSKKGYPPNRRDDGTNLWILHGKDKVGGSFFAKKKNGDFLNLNDVFDYCKDFLEKHPTETIMIDIAIQGIDVDEDKALDRLNRHIRRLSQEINPSTGESYLYMEDGDYLKVLDGYPQLKDCRGKIVLQGDTVGNGSGGLKKGAGLSAVYGPEGDFHDDSKLKIEHLKAFYGKYGYDPLPTDASNGKQVIDYYYSVGTNCTDPATVPQITPLHYAKEVLPVLFNDDDGLLIDRQSLYLGLVNMDGANAKNNRQVWITNFGKLEYCTVVAKDSPNDPNPKVYTVLKNTPIPIPECIYPDPNSERNYFEYWKATKGAGDTPGELINTFYPGDTYTVTEDVTFTAVWEQNGSSNIRVDWNDGNDADGLRPNTLSLTVTEDGSQEPKPTHSEIVTSEGGWSKLVNYHVWHGVETQQGITVNDCPEGYSYDVKGSKITMTHKPEKSIEVHGQIDWRDKGEEAGTRPGRTTLKLYKNGEEKEEIQPTKEAGWNYAFGTHPLYEADSKGRYKRIAYRLEEDPVEGYSIYTSPVGDGKDIQVINTLVEHHMTVEGMVLWVDEDNNKNTRPEEVKVHLHAKGKEVGERTVSKDENGYWVFSFPMDQGVSFSGYSVTVDPIADYITQTYIEDVDGVAYVINILNQHIHDFKRIEGVSKEPTCIDEGVKTTFDVCVKCGKVENRTDEIIPALGHDWGKWETVTESTETEPGLEQRVCDRDHSHIETREMSPIGHRHDPKRVERKEATCTEPGNIPYFHCKGCGWNFIDGAHPGTTYLSEGEEIIPPLGHDWSDWETVKPATEDEPGLEKRVCKHESSHVETRETPKKVHRHELEHVARKEATCEDPGNISYYHCEGCGWYCKDGAHPGTTWFKKGEEVIPAKGHVWNEWETTKEPTETEEGLEQRKCQRDPSHIQKRAIPTLHHTHAPKYFEAKAPTCMEEGNISYYYCEGCRWYFKDGAHPGTTWFKEGEQVIPALGHDWGEPTFTWADDLSSVKAERGCRHEGCTAKETETAETTSQVIKEPAADEDGETLYTAKFENEAFCTQTKTVVIPKTGASYYIEKGNNQTWYKGSDKTVDFTFKRSANDKTTFSHFTGIKVDGKVVDPGDYTKESGSVIIKLKPSYLNVLNKGKHVITAEFDDGRVSAIFNVADNESGGNSGGNGSNNGDNGSTGNNSNNGNGSRTGDEHNILMWFAIMLVALLVMSGYALQRRRR